MGGVGVFAGDGFVRRGGMVLGGVWCACGMECWCCSFQCRPIGAIYMIIVRLRRHWGHSGSIQSFRSFSHTGWTELTGRDARNEIHRASKSNVERLCESKRNKSPVLILPSLTVGFRVPAFPPVVEEVLLVVGYSVPSPPRPHQFRSRGCGVPSHPCLAEPPFNLSGIWMQNYQLVISMRFPP